jgi:hypothetical protein
MRKECEAVVQSSKAACSPALKPVHNPPTHRFAPLRLARGVGPRFVRDGATSLRFMARRAHKLNLVFTKSENSRLQTFVAGDRRSQIFRCFDRHRASSETGRVFGRIHRTNEYRCGNRRCLGSAGMR